MSFKTFSFFFINEKEQRKIIELKSLMKLTTINHLEPFILTLF